MTDTTTPRTERVMRVRRQPWHRYIDPGVDNGDGLFLNISNLAGAIRNLTEMQETWHMTGTNAARNIVLMEEILVMHRRLLADLTGLEPVRRDHDDEDDGGPISIP